MDEFRPVSLAVEKIGPFQEKPFVLDFTDDSGEPCNFFMLISKNGRGKTTLLDMLTVLFSLLEHDERESFGFEDLDSGSGAWAKLDAKVSIRSPSGRFHGIFSIAAGDFPANGWNTPEPETLAKLGNPPAFLFGYRRRASGRLEKILVGEKDHKSIFQDFLAAVRYESGAGQKFGEPLIALPTLLYFDAKRDIPKVEKGTIGIVKPESWGYRPAHRFSHEGGEWSQSLDNLLVWLYWLDDGSFDHAADLINKTVFLGKTKFLKGIRKQPPQAIVQSGTTSHRIDRLSSGEKSIVQILLQTEAHKTHLTWLVVDEMDAHFHPNMEHWFLKTLKKMIVDNPGMTVVATAHSREILKSFAFEIKEEGLVKGGHLIEDDLDVAV